MSKLNALEEYELDDGLERNIQMEGQKEKKD